MSQGCVLSDSYGRGSRLTVPSLLGTTETLGPRWCLPRVFPAKLLPCLCGDKCFLGDHSSCKVLLLTQLLPPFLLSIDASCLRYYDDGGNCANVIIPSAFTTWRPIVIPSGALLYYSISYSVPAIVSGLAGGSGLLRLSDMSPEFSVHFLSFWY